MNRLAKQRYFLQQTDSQRNDNDFHIVHVCDSRPPQLANSGAAVFARVPCSGPFHSKTCRGSWNGMNIATQIQSRPWAIPPPLGPPHLPAPLLSAPFGPSPPSG